MAADVHISKIDTSFIRLNCEQSILYELEPHFTFFVPGYRFMPKFKNKMWDGQIRLLHKGTGVIGAGLLRDLIKLLKELGYTYHIDHDLAKMYVSKSLMTIDEYIEDLPCSKDPRDYQLASINDGVNNRRGIILSPTGSGKSLIIYYLVRYFVDCELTPDQKVLVVVPTINLVHQLVSDFEEYATPDTGWFPESEMHKICEGADKRTEKQIIVSTWQSLQNQPKQWFAQFGAVLCDEVHQFKSTETSKIVESANRAEIKLGFTGSLDDTKTHEMMLRSLFGKAKQHVTTKDLMESGTLASMKIHTMIVQHHQPEVKMMLTGTTYQQEVEFVSTSTCRQRFLGDLVKALKGNTMILFSRVESQARPFYDMLKAECGDRPVYLIVGGVKGTEREEIRKIIESHTNAILVASYGTMSTGANIINLDNVILGSPTKSKIRVVQTIGRGLRKGERKQKARVFDIVDDIHSGKKQCFATKHFEERLAIYDREGFEYEVSVFQLKD